MNYHVLFYQTDMQLCNVVVNDGNDGNDVVFCTLWYHPVYGWSSYNPEESRLIPLVEREWQAHLLSLITRA